MDHLLSKCDHRLHNLLRNGVDLQKLSRIPATRLQQMAVPNIGSIELVSAEAFEKFYQPLYLSMFHGAERERAALIVRRLSDDFAGKRTGLAPYRIVGLRDSLGEAIGAAQFSVLMLRRAVNDSGGKIGPERFAVPYVQYIYVRAQNRRQDLSEVLHTFVLAVASADAARLVDLGPPKEVPFTLFETEPPGHGEMEASRATATERTAIHARSGARAMMLRSKTTGRCISAHVQPGLEPGDGPLTLCWATRPSPLGCVYDCNSVGRASIAAYYQSLRDEGFPEENIALAERMVARRCQDTEFCEMPLADVTASMYQHFEHEVEHATC